MNLSPVHKARGANLNPDELACLGMVIQGGRRGDGTDQVVSLDVLAWQGLARKARKLISQLERRVPWITRPLPSAITGGGF